MKRRIISCLLICALVVLTLVSCGASAKTFEGKTYAFSKVDIRLNSSLSKDAKSKAATAVKTAYGSQSTPLKDVLKDLEKERAGELEKISYKFEKDGKGVFTFEKDDDETFVQNFKYEVHSKDNFLVLWWVDEEGERTGDDQVFEIKGKKLVMQASESNMVETVTLKKSK